MSGPRLFGLFTIFVILLILVSASNESVAHSQAIDWKEGYTLIVLKGESIEEMNAARTYILEQGGRISVLIPPHVILGWVPATISRNLIGKYGIESIHHQEVSTQAIAYRDEATLQGIDFFNRVAAGEPEGEKPSGSP